MRQMHGCIAYTKWFWCWHLLLGELSKQFAQKIGNATLGGDFLLDLTVSWGVNKIVGSMETDITLLLIELATPLPMLALLSFIVLVTGKPKKHEIGDSNKKCNIRKEKEEK
jgi:hypothetical protein